MPEKAIILGIDDLEAMIQGKISQLMGESTNEDNEVLLTIAETADLLKVTKPTIHKLMKQAKGLPYFKIGKSTRFRKSEVLAYIENKMLNR
jgi:excisionase family DNA binding protein